METDKAGRLAGLNQELGARGALLVAVSKTQSPQRIRELYQLGQRDFGENYVQELLEKTACLPPDIRWHFIGHLQSNKVKAIVPFVHCIESIDSLRLLTEVNRQSTSREKIMDCLLQVHIAREQSKFGLDEQQLLDLASQVIARPGEFLQVRIRGLMGMATLTSDQEQIRSEFRKLRELRDRLKSGVFKDMSSFTELSMGMSADYRIALQEGSTLVRIGSLLFGPRA